MRRNLCLVVSLLTGLVLSSQVLAQDMNNTVAQPTPAAGPTMSPSTTPMPSMTSGATSGMHPCRNIKDACMAANMGKTKQEVWMNCVKPLMMGQTVSGVTIDPNDIQACKTKIMQHKQMGGWHHNPGATTPSTTTQTPAM